MSNMPRKSREPSLYAGVDTFTSEGGRVPSAEGERQMAELGISLQGVDFDYKGYRYEELAHAVAYARLRNSSYADSEDGTPPRHRRAFVAPTRAEQTLMDSLGIQFDGRRFRFAGFSYDRLADAVSYARRAAGVH